MMCCDRMDCDYTAVLCSLCHDILSHVEVAFGRATAILPQLAAEEEDEEAEQTKRGTNIDPQKEKKNRRSAMLYH